MPTHSASPVGDSPKMIHMDCTSIDFGPLLTVIDKGANYSPNWNQIIRILDIGKRYQFKHVPDLVRYHVTRCLGGHNAKAIFQFAGSNEYPDLARAAIAEFGGDSSIKDQNFDEITLSICDGIPGRYGAALLVAMSKYTYSRNTYEPNRWQKISGAFDLTR
jgi:hypothetical protein